MATSNLPIRITTDDIGDDLEEYGSKPNTHIAYFYIKLGHEISKSPMSQKEALATYNRTILDPNQRVKEVVGWDGVFFFQVSKTAIDDERKIEFKIHDTIRRSLIIDLSENCPDIHIIFSRACLYKENMECASSQGITTDKIGEIMKNVYEQNVSVTAHIEYFLYKLLSEKKAVTQNNVR